MPKTHARNVKKGKFKMLLFFLLVTFFIWFLTKFSKEFTATVNASIEFENIPSNTVLASNNIDELSFDLTSSGFDFLSYKLKKPVITINVSEYYSKEKQSTIISNANLIKIISSELSSKIAVKNVSVNEIIVVLDKIISKELPIIIDSDLSFQNGFQVVEELSIDPSIVVVSGPSTVIDSLTEVTTKQIKLDMLETDASGEIELDTSEQSKLSYSIKNVSYKIVVEEFTQKELFIPITVEHLPIGTSIKLLPEVISVVFDVSVSKFNSVSEKDFKVICDYNNRSGEENIITVEIVKKPIIIQNVYLKNNKIEYLIFK